MAFAFANLANLLERLEHIEQPNTQTRIQRVAVDCPKLRSSNDVIQNWFKCNRSRIDHMTLPSALALISSFLPERRTDRVYSLQASNLCPVLGRCFGLNATRARDLHAYKQPGNGDLAVCVERVLKVGGPPALPNLMLDEVDYMLNRLARLSRFSDAAFRNAVGEPSESREAILENIFKRASPTEGKWLVRLILKDFSPVCIESRTVLKNVHFLLPGVLRFQDDLTAALTLLRGPLRDFPSNPDPRSERAHQSAAAEKLRPVVGTQVGRPTFVKIRSIDHCIKRTRGQSWVLERKYDGEYCEIHIRRSAAGPPSAWIKIFSKSGKDSTQDRKGLHETLVTCLRLGQAACKIKHQAILLGELVVWSDVTNSVMPFEEIRKHISRSGVFLGTEKDLQPHEHEHLAIAFFDILLLDEEVIMNRPIEVRRKRLKEVYMKIPGRAMSTEWKVVDFSNHEGAKKKLMQQFAASNAQRCEGLVLKPCGQPYCSLQDDARGSASAFLKLKKDYIEGLGEEADFAVVGASYNAQRAQKCRIPGLKYTDFHLGCLTNPEQAIRFGHKPHFKLVGSICAGESCIPKPELVAANRLASQQAIASSDLGTESALLIDNDTKVRLDIVFNYPFVFEVLGSGFEQPSNCDFQMLRFPRVKKLHQDRSWHDCITFDALAQQANIACGSPHDSESQEVLRWMNKLEQKCIKKTERERATRTPSSPDASCEITIGATVSVAGQGLHFFDETSLEGSTLVATGSSQSKRKASDAAPNACPSSKCQKKAGPEAMHGSDLGIQHAASPCALVTSSPLAEIINSVSSRRSSLGKDGYGPFKSTFVQFQTGAIVCKSWKALAADEVTRRIPPPKYERQCAGSACAFAHCVVHLASCIARMPYVTEDLLKKHACCTVSQLAHWDRDSFAFEGLGQVVGESQAYIGRRKVVLVESKRRAAVESMVHRLLELNAGRFKERIEIFDWRALELCNGHDVTFDRARQHFVGATMYDQGRDVAEFVSALPWLSTTAS